MNRVALRSLFVAALPAALIAAVTSGCSPVYAPPVRAVAYGAPGRVRAGDVEIGGTMAGVYTPNAGSAYVAVGVRDWVSVEGGGTFAVAPAGPQQGAFVMGMGWLGPRFTLPRRRYGVSLLLDGELGLGAGIGGEGCTTNASGATTCASAGKNAAFGGYQGGGLGFAYQWFSLYGRARLEESSAAGLPVTYWPSALLGLGFDLTPRNLNPRLSLDVAAGYLGYFDARDSQNGWMYQTGLSLRFGRGR